MTEDPLRHVSELLGSLLDRIDDDHLIDCVIQAEELLQSAPPEDRPGLVRIVAREIAVYQLRRAQSVWTTGSRMHLHPAPRIYARHDRRTRGNAFLRQAATHSTIQSVSSLAEAVVASGPPPEAELAAACAALSPAVRRQTLTLVQQMLARVRLPET